MPTTTMPLMVEHQASVGLTGVQELCGSFSHCLSHLAVQPYNLAPFPNTAGLLRVSSLGVGARAFQPQRPGTA